MLEEASLKAEPANHAVDRIEDDTEASVEEVVSEVKSLNVENEENLDNQQTVD